MLEEKIGARTILLALVSLLAAIEGLVLIRLAF